jgi:uncharacterized RmlC-like cupin family protein
MDGLGCEAKAQGEFMQYQSIGVVRPKQFDSATAQAPGSQRFAAIHRGAGIESPMWGGLFQVEPAARTGIHHHGGQHTIAYVLSGSSYVRWGERGEFNAMLHAGDFLLSRHFFLIRRLIRPARNLSNGLWSGALPNRLL